MSYTSKGVTYTFRDTTLYGGNGNDTLNGGVGADLLYGGDDNDTLNGGAGNDTLTGDAGIDALNGGAGDDTLYDTTSDAGGALSGGDGNDLMQIVAGGGAWIIDGGTGIDTLAASGSLGAGSNVTVDRLILNNGTLTVQPGVINGIGGIASNGYTLAHAAAGTTDLSAAAFDASYTYNGSTSTNTLNFSGSTGADTLIMSAAGLGTLYASGGAGDDNITAGAGKDLLYGGDDNDTLNGGAGNDTLTGGAGADTFGFSTALGSGNVDRITDFVAMDDTLRLDASVFAGLTAGPLVASAFKDLSKGGLDGDDRIVYDASTGSLFYDADGSGSGTAVQFAILGNKATLSAADVVVTSTGTGGGTGLNVVAGATAGNDTLTGTSGNDLLNGGAGADSLGGLAGNDTYVVDNAGDIVTEAVNDGTDTVQISLTSYTLGANIENLTYTGTVAFTGTGNALDNTITGSSGADKLSGGLGADTMIGRAGNDTYTVDNIGDVVREDTNTGVDDGGLDLVNSSASFTLGAFVENLTLTGTAAISATGNAGANILIGNAGANILNGGDGNDRLVGNAGIDTLTGGVGADIFVFGPSIATSADKVMDFSSVAGDALEFRALDFGLNAGSGLDADGGLNADYFEIGTAATKLHGEFLFNSSTKQLLWDADGSGSAAGVAVATFTVPSGIVLTNFLHASDFHIA